MNSKLSIFFQVLMSQMENLSIELLRIHLSALTVFLIHHWHCHTSQKLWHDTDTIFKCIFLRAWWCHPMEIFSALLAICEGNSPVIGEFPTQRTVTRSFDVLFDLRLNKQLSKQWWGWWFEMPSCSSWRHCNGNKASVDAIPLMNLPAKF